MSKLDRLIAKFEGVVAQSWSATLAGPQRVWMVVYDEGDERRLRVRREEFAHAAQSAGHPMWWCDLTDAFADWMAEQEYREAYFEYPEDLMAYKGPLEGFRTYVADLLRGVLADADETALVGVTGVGALFGLARVSEVIEAVHGDIRGRFAVFFPGTRRGNTYRLLDARDGWNYLALPISA